MKFWKWLDLYVLAVNAGETELANDCMKEMIESTGVVDNIKEAYENGGIIPAVKVYKQIFDCRLVEARNNVIGMASERKWVKGK